MHEHLPPPLSLRPQLLLLSALGWHRQLDELPHRYARLYLRDRAQAQAADGNGGSADGSAPGDFASHEDDDANDDDDIDGDFSDHDRGKVVDGGNARGVHGAADLEAGDDADEVGSPLAGAGASARFQGRVQRVWRLTRSRRTALGHRRAPRGGVAEVSRYYCACTPQCTAGRGGTGRCRSDAAATAFTTAITVVTAATPDSPQPRWAAAWCDHARARGCLRLVCGSVAGSAATPPCRAARDNCLRTRCRHRPLAAQVFEQLSRLRLSPSPAAVGAYVGMCTQLRRYEAGWAAFAREVGRHRAWTRAGQVGVPVQRMLLLCDR